MYRNSSINSYSNREIRNLIVNGLCKNKYLTLLNQVSIILKRKEYGRSKRVKDILERI